MVPTEAGQSVPMSGTKRKILNCFRSPLFPWVSFLPQRFITSQGPTLPANQVCSYLPFLGFKQTPHIQKQALRLLFGKGDNIMCLLSIKWPLMSSCLCNQEPKHSPNVTCPDRGHLITPLQASALSLNHKAVILVLPSSYKFIRPS